MSSNIRIETIKITVEGNSSASTFTIGSIFCMGINNEETARSAYLTTSDDKHDNFKLTITGLHVNPSYPHLGTSPDGLISCSCCGEGVLELKCP